MFTITEKPEQEIKITLFKQYRILNKDTDYQNLVSMLNVLSRATATMDTPLMFHFVSEIDIDLFKTERFIQKFKECFISEVKLRNKQRKKDNSTLRTRKVIPDIEMIYSIESKPSKYNPDELYNHIHIMVIIDSKHNLYGEIELTKIVNKTLSRINGLQKIEYEHDSVVGVKDDKPNFYGLLKPRDSESKIKPTDDYKYQSLLCHNLKLEFFDAVIRVSYLCKTTQKELLPERFKKMNFNVTRVKRNSANDNEQQVA